MYIDHSSIHSSRLTRRLLQAGVHGSLRRRKYQQTLAALTLQASLRSVGVSLYSDKNTCKRACMHKAYVFMYLHVCVCTCLLTYAHRAGNSQGGVCVMREGARVWVEQTMTLGYRLPTRLEADTGSGQADWCSNPLSTKSEVCWCANNCSSVCACQCLCYWVGPCSWR